MGILVQGLRHMCGICGAVPLNGSLDPRLADALPWMTRALKHRGPDGEGFYRSLNTVLGHRRLSIIDREGGAQPMCNEDRSVWVVFNGEIYNHRALRAVLISRGHVFRTASDTEAILHGYEEYGEGIVEKLEGMFAFALFDEANRALLLARDRVGKKPLFYATLDGVLHFASEIKAMRHSPLWDDSVDRDAIESYVSLGYILAPRTIYQQVKKLPPGHLLSMRNGTVSVRRYWDVQEFDSDARDAMTIVNDVDSRIANAVTARLESEVPLGAFLSGGIDSGLIVSYMAESLASVVTTSVGFGDNAHNELDGAALTASHLHTIHHPEQVEPELESVLDAIAAAFDEPFADSSAVPTHYVSSLARRHVTVALSGDGGDEVFGGYGFRYVPHLAEHWVRRVIGPAGLGPGLSAIGRIWPRSQQMPRPLRLGTYLENMGGTAAEAYYSDICFLKPRATRQLIGASSATDYRDREPFTAVSAVYEKCPSDDPVQKAQYADLHVYLPNDVLVKVDRMSMLHGLEVRSPLLDHRIIETAFRIPRQIKLKGLEAKHVLRSIARRRLPPALLDLPKHGFTAPVSRWVRERASTLREEVLGSGSPVTAFVDRTVARRWLDAHVHGREEHGYALWALWMLHKWHQNSRTPSVVDRPSGGVPLETGRSVLITH